VSGYPLPVIVVPFCTSETVWNIRFIYALHYSSVLIGFLANVATKFVADIGNLLLILETILRY
jgi:hypothetical protein